MIRQILIGGRGEKSEILIVASNAEEISEIKKTIKLAATEGSYKGFDYLDTWTRSGGNRVIRLKAKPKLKKTNLSKTLSVKSDKAAK